MIQVTTEGKCTFNCGCWGSWAGRTSDHKLQFMATPEKLHLSKLSLPQSQCTHLFPINIRQLRKTGTWDKRKHYWDESTYLHLACLVSAVNFSFKTLVSNTLRIIALRVLILAWLWTQHINHTQQFLIYLGIYSMVNREHLHRMAFFF